MLSNLPRACYRMNASCFQRNLFISPESAFVPLRLPSRRETHLWYVRPEELKSASLLNQYFEMLSPSEKEKVMSMRGVELKKSALLARALVRTTIARYQINGYVDPRSLKFRKTIYGKPEIEWENDENWSPPRLHFNISHTSSLIACGVTVDAPIGIDVEEKYRRTQHKILAFARRFFTPHEVKLLTSLQDPEVQRQEVIKLWTLKEAYVKAIGRGFSAAPFKTFTIHSIHATHSDSEETHSEIIVEPVESPDPTNLTTNWQFALLELADSHYAAICMEKDEASEGKRNAPMKLMIRKTIPLVEDEFVSGTDTVVAIGGLIEQERL